MTSAQTARINIIIISAQTTQHEKGSVLVLCHLKTFTYIAIHVLVFSNCRWSITSAMFAYLLQILCLIWVENLSCDFFQVWRYWKDKYSHVSREQNEFDFWISEEDTLFLVKSESAS